MALDKKASLNIFEYEEILMGRKKSFVSSFTDNQKENEIAIGNIWRYAVERLLHWTAEEARRYMDDDVVTRLCLDKTFVGIRFKREGNYIADYSFMLRYAFPKDIWYNERVEAVREYEKVAKIGPWRNDKSKTKYPKKFFADESGEKRAKYLMNYVVGLYLQDEMSMIDLYKFFADEQTARKWLTEKRLGVPLRTLYGTPLEYYHASLPYREKNDLLYYSFKIKEKVEQKILEIPLEEWEENELPYGLLIAEQQEEQKKKG